MISEQQNEAKPTLGAAEHARAETAVAAGHSDPTTAEDAAAAEKRASHAPELAAEDMSFAEMFELAEKQSKAKKQSTRESIGSDLQPGQVIIAKVVGFSHDSVFLDVGAKAEGVIAKSELLNEAGELSVKDGDKIEARVRSIENGQVTLTKVLAHQSLKNRDHLREAHRAGIPVEGKITGVNKGGLDVEISGMRAFLPVSQIDLRFCDNPAQYVGQKVVLKITELKDGGRNVVVSRRAILIEEKRKKADELLETLKVGARVKGVVTTLKDYGAFIDLGGVEGLIHVSEISHGRVSKPSEALRVGQEVEAEIIRIEDARDKDKDKGKKISLSIKSIVGDPWENAKATIREGEKVKGRVSRIQPFGAFVEILPGVDGLIHVSNMSEDRVSNPRDILKEGDEIEATVVSADWDKRRIGLSIARSRQELANQQTVGSVLEGVIDRVESFGVFVKLPGGARGLVPAAESGTQRGSDLKKEFRPGSKVKVSVVEVDPESGKIRLSVRGAVEAEERAEYTGYMKSSGTGGSGLGTLGDLLRNRGERKK